MQYFLFILIAIIAGVLIPIQSGLNSQLGNAVKNPVMGALLSFIVGTVGLLSYCLISRVDLSQWKNGLQMPWYYWTGGLMGAFFVYALIIVPPRLGIGLTLGITVAAQMIFGLWMDHNGWLGFPQDPISLTKVAGAVLIVMGVFLLRG